MFAQSLSCTSSTSEYPREGKVSLSRGLGLERGSSLSLELELSSALETAAWPEGRGDAAHA